MDRAANDSSVLNNHGAFSVIVKTSGLVMDYIQFKSKYVSQFKCKTPPQ